MGWERELAVLEKSLQRLNAEYDAFLYGTAMKPPLENRKHVDLMFRRLASEAADSAADRFRLTTLQGRYSALCEKWDRLQGEKELGRRPGLYGHFAPPEPPRKPPAPPNAGRPVSVSPREEAPASEESLFEKFVGAKIARGEEVANYRFEDFQKGLQQQREAIRQRLGTEAIEFDVVERDGSVKLVARRKPGGG